jgi:hypothetical protein
MEFPTGSIQGLCSSAATGFAVCIAFLGAWGFQGQGHWRAVDLFVLLPLAFAAGGFGFTPLLATRPVKLPERSARRLYRASMILVLLALVAALIIEYTKA